MVITLSLHSHDMVIACPLLAPLLDPESHIGVRAIYRFASGGEYTCRVSAMLTNTKRVLLYDVLQVCW